MPFVVPVVASSTFLFELSEALLSIDKKKIEGMNLNLLQPRKWVSRPRYMDFGVTHGKRNILCRMLGINMVHKRKRLNYV